MTSDNQETSEKVDKRKFLPQLWKKGQSGNPAGRPKGFSLKEWTRERLAAMTDEERDEFLEGIPKAEIWKMSEGNPKQDTDITSGGQPLTPLLVQFLDDKSDNADTKGV